MAVFIFFVTFSFINPTTGIKNYGELWIKGPRPKVVPLYSGIIFNIRCWLERTGTRWCMMALCLREDTGNMFFILITVICILLSVVAWSTPSTSLSWRSLATIPCSMSSLPLLLTILPMPRSWLLLKIRWESHSVDRTEESKN